MMVGVDVVEWCRAIEEGIAEIGLIVCPPRG